MGYNKKWQKAVSLLDEMELNGITPDESCYVTAIIACSKVASTIILNAIADVSTWQRGSYHKRNQDTLVVPCLQTQAA